jgi:hypothetical protein
MLSIEPIGLHWLMKDDPEIDLCAHGGVRVTLGARVLCDSKEDAFAVSTGALHLLRTLNDDYLLAANQGLGDQLIPCCGHFMVVDSASGKVVNCGCPAGLGWEVRHGHDRSVHLKFDSGDEISVPLADWRRAVFEFSEAVRAFYFLGPEKRPCDEDVEWHAAFMNEWLTRHEETWDTDGRPREN